jgi:hypothetical protein
MITPGDPHQQFSDILASLLIAVFGFPIVSFVALASAPPWLVDFFERLGLVEDCNNHPLKCSCEMREFQAGKPEESQKTKMYVTLDVK